MANEPLLDHTPSPVGPDLVSARCATCGAPIEWRGARVFCVPADDSHSGVPVEGLRAAANAIRERHVANEWDSCVACRAIYPCDAELFAVEVLDYLAAVPREASEPLRAGVEALIEAWDEPAYHPGDIEHRLVPFIRDLRISAGSRNVSDALDGSSTIPIQPTDRNVEGMLASFIDEIYQRGLDAPEAAPFLLDALRFHGIVIHANNGECYAAPREAKTPGERE